MANDLEDRNARAVVQTWRSGVHLHAWAPAAHGLLPSTVTRAAAIAWGNAAHQLECSVQDLLALGYLVTNMEISRLRKHAAQFAQHARAGHAWAAALERAELELPGGNDGR